MEDRPEGEYVSDLELFDWLRSHRRPDGMAQPTILWGAAGLGKTSRVGAYTRARDLTFKKYLPAHDSSGEDLSGLRVVSGNRTRRQLPDWLPIESDGPTVLFIDEINRAPQSVQDGLLELVGEGTLSAGDYHLPPDALIVAAANPADLEHAVHDIDNAFIDRFLHIDAGFDPAPWAAWADGVDDLHRAAVDFALANPRLIERGEPGFPVQLQNRIKPTPRAVTNLGYLLDDTINVPLLHVLARGMLGTACEKDFVAWWGRYQRGARPLTFGEIAAGDYRSVISAWNREDADHSISDALVEATNERIVSRLTATVPDQDTALFVGHYLSLIHEGVREHFFESLRRAASAWLPLLEESCLRWIERQRTGRG